MKIIYICGVIPENVNDRRKLSVAGNKFSLNMIKSLDRCTGGGVEVISTSSSGLEYTYAPLYEDKCYFVAQRKGGLVFGELYQAYMVFSLLKKMRRVSKNERIVVMVENSPFAVMIAVDIFRKKFRVPAFSVIIDTPFTASFERNTFVGKIHKIKFLIGQKKLKRFNGIISFCPEVENDLNISLPFHQLKIGHNEEVLPSVSVSSGKETHSIVYAGTLIYYNGIFELLDAFELLDNRYHLHIYGYGPLEDIVKKRARESSNITFHGRFDPKCTRQILQMYDASINPRLIDPYIENYTFPSKLIDYVLAGRPVLSSHFKTMPSGYLDFIYIFDDTKPSNIANSIVALFEEDEADRQNRVALGVQYVFSRQSYLAIAEGIIRFLETYSK